MNKYLVIFIDGFPYELLKKLNSLNKFSYKFSLTPGIGYSVNIHAEIFAGLSPDEAGFFNTWKYDSTNSPFRILKSIKGTLERFGDNRYLNRIFRNAIRVLCGCDSLNIPYRFIDLFAPYGHSIYSKDFPRFKLVPGEITEKDIKFDSDEKRYVLTEKRIEKGRLFLFFTEPDRIAHKLGLDSEEYSSCLNRLGSRISSLYDKFKSTYPDGHIVVFSDHGMSRVSRAIRLDLEKHFSPKEMQNFIYFLDTTILRIWYLDSKVKNNVESFLNNRDYGRLLTNEERADFGIASKSWADSIFVLNEGYVFDPSFLEKGRSVAMHGYHPGLPWQKGIFLYSGPKVFPDQDTIGTKDCYNILKEICER